MAPRGGRAAIQQLLAEAYMTFQQQQSDRTTVYAASAESDYWEAVRPFSRSGDGITAVSLLTKLALQNCDGHPGLTCCSHPPMQPAAWISSI